MLRRSFYRASVALNGTTINPNVKAAKVRVPRSAQIQSSQEYAATLVLCSTQNLRSRGVRTT